MRETCLPNSEGWNVRVGHPDTIVKIEKILFFQISIFINLPTQIIKINNRVSIFA